MGFAVPAPTLEQQIAKEASTFKGGTVNGVEIPSGASGLSIRAKALEAAATGEFVKNASQGAYYAKNASLLDPEFALKQKEFDWKKKVEEGAATRDEMRVAMEGEKNEIARQEASSQGMYRAGILEVEQGRLKEERRQFDQKRRDLINGLDMSHAASREKALTQYDNFNKRFSTYKTGLREQLKAADRQTTIQQMFGDYFSYKSTVNPSDPLEVAGLQGATADVMLTLVEELTKLGGGDTDLDRIRITNYLDTIQAAASQGLLPENITKQIQLTLRTAGYGQKNNKWIIPQDGGGGGGFFSGGAP